MEKNVCQYCHIAFDKQVKVCPSCGREIKSEQPLMDKEGEGRKHRAGGEACDYCAHCYGSADWCPLLD